MKTKALVYTLAAFAPVVMLIACGGKSSSSPQPRNLRGEAMAAKPLSTEDKAEFVAIFKKGAAAPDKDFYFSDNYSSGDLKNKYDKLSDDAKKMIPTVKSKCKIDPGQEKILKEQMIGDNHVIKVTEKSKGISGDPACPLSYLESNKTSMDITIDRAAGVMSGTTVVDSETSDEAKSEELKRLSWLVSSNMKSHMVANYANYKMNGEKSATGSLTMRAEVSGTMTDAEGKLYKMSASMELAQNGPSTTLNAVLRFMLPNMKELVIGMFANGDKVELLVNGEPYTAEKWQAEFGSPFPIKDRSLSAGGSGTSALLNF